MELEVSVAVELSADTSPEVSVLEVSVELPVVPALEVSVELPVVSLLDASVVSLLATEPSSVVFVGMSVAVGSATIELEGTGRSVELADALAMQAGGASIRLWVRECQVLNAI